MQEPAPGIPLERLVAHREWVRRVARALVRDESLADDLEQEVWVEALERPPRTTSALGGWLAAAMRHNLADRRRSEGSRRAREESVARPEREKSAAELVAEAEMFKRLVAAVLDLDEPGRETILLRYFEDLPLKEVARRQGVPLETVRTRIRSGIATLKRRFDAESGSRGAWSVALAPIVGEFARVRGSTPSPPPLATTAGALIMGTKVKLAAGAVCVALFGFAAWQVVAPGPIETTGGEARIARRDSSLPRREAARAEADGPESSPKPVAGDPATPARTPSENPVVQVYGVVRSPDGLPVSGAKVLREVERSEPVEVAVADENGEFLVQEPVDAVALHAVAPGYGQSATWDVRARPDGVVRIEMRLRRTPGSLRGRVLGTLGQPVEGARVRIGGRSYSGGIRIRPRQGEALVRTPEPIELRTDSSGAFVAESLPAGHAELLVRAEAMTTAWDYVVVEAGRVTEVEYRLARAGQLSGVVRDASGNAVPNATIEVLAVGGNLVTRSGPDGAYSIQSVPVAGCLAVARSEDGGRAQSDLSFGDGEKKVWDPVLGRGSEIRGRLVDERGAPLRGWAVFAIAGELETGHFSTARTGADGAFSLANCVDLPYLLLVSREERAVPVVTRKGVLAGAGELTLVVADDSLPSVFISGRVVDMQGRPRDRVFALATDPERGLGHKMVENDSTTGAFLLGPLPPGRINLAVSSLRSNGHIFRGQYFLARGKDLDLGTIVEAPPGILRVSFLAEEGVDAGFAQYTVEPIRDAPGPREMRIGDAKEEAILTLPAGRWSVSVSGALMGDEAKVDLVSASETRVVLNLRKATARWFRIHGPGQRTVAQTVRLTARDGRNARVGNFHYGRGSRDAVLAAAYLVPGTYEIEVLVDDGSEHRRMVTIHGDEGESMDEPIDFELR